MHLIENILVLAGGFGTRLQSVVADQPKCLAPIDNEPFLHYLIHYFKQQKAQRIVFSLGYKSELVIQYLQTKIIPHCPQIEIDWVVEQEPLGTGGAIVLAMQKIKSDNLIVMNGDTFFQIHLNTLLQRHKKSNAVCSLALKKMSHFDRYGVVETKLNGEIIAFQEKKFYAEGLINGGVYILDKKKFLSQPYPNKFSFEKEFLEKQIQQQALFGFEFENYFIDIGVPNDYAQAQKDLPSFL